MSVKTLQRFKAHQLHRFIVPLSDRVYNFPFPCTLSDQNLVHQIRNVLRLSAGSGLIIVDCERQISYVATLDNASRNQVHLSLQQVYETGPGDSLLPHISLGVSLIKGQRWDWLLQKVTELGVKSISPIQSERAVVHVGTAEKKQERWEAIIRSAAEQCEALSLPELSSPQKLEAFCQQMKHYPLKLVLMARGTQRIPLRLALRSHASARSIAVLVGPEGGWTDDEAQLVLSYGFKPVSVGERILRSETATIAMLSGMVYEFEQM